MNNEWQDEPRREPKEPEQFDTIGKAITYVVGWGVVLSLIVLFVRLILWIIGVW